MLGTVTSYNSVTGSLVVNVTSVNGSGTSLSPWVIWVSVGAQGVQGIAGEQGIQGDKGDTGEGAITGGTPGQIYIKNSITDYDVRWGSANNAKRQTVLVSSLDANGLPNFISIGTGLVVNIAATSIPVITSFAAGFGVDGGIEFIGSVSTDDTITSLTNNAVNYLFIERDATTGAITLGKTIKKPQYSPYKTAEFKSQYPATFDANTVKATSTYSAYYYPNFAVDPSKSLINGTETGSWISQNAVVANQRFHVDLGTAKIITKLYYENGHHNGTLTNMGVQNFTVWGSNDDAAFAELTYAVDTNWTQITANVSVFDQHTASNIADPKYVTLTNTIAYRYYALKFQDNYGGTSYMGLRRIEFQEEAQYVFSVNEMIMYDGGVPKQIVFVGEALTSGGNVASVINYALNGRYVSSETALATIQTISSFNHNLGTQFGVIMDADAICVGGDYGWVVDEICKNPVIGINTGTYIISLTPLSLNGRNTCSFITGYSYAIMVPNKTAGSVGNLVAATIARWKLRIYVERKW
jgi:hypothetical protein